MNKKKGFILLLLVIVVTAVAFYLFKAGNITTPDDETSTSTQSTTTSVSTGDKNPLLTPSQEDMLENAGIDPASLPQTLTPEMIACAREKLGTERTDEIINGATPTMADYYKARSCF
ncbi:MAG: hypothetical protein WD874_01795 [Parcubacteria group bacterium]